MAFAEIARIAAPLPSGKPPQAASHTRNEHGVELKDPPSPDAISGARALRDRLGAP
jgi:hypothetical protein